VKIEWRGSGRALAIAMAAVLAACAGTEGLGVNDLLRAAGAAQTGALDESTIVAGLKDALRVGTERAVTSTSAVNGFLGNELIRIALPEQLDATAKGLRAVGFGAQVDELEVAMNRAAERAAGEATPIFIDAVQAMSFADARAILSGPEDAATRYFERKTSDGLRARFAPIVDASMQEVGLARLYESLMGNVRRLPLVPSPDLELDAYVTDRSLAGLFTVLGQEEARIRADPAARSTELLRRVFAGR
jgi:hypothetical protein